MERIDFSRLSLTSVLGALWGWLLPLYVHIAATVPLQAMATLWCLDMAFGLLRAVKEGGLRAICLKRAEDGITKLAKYSLVLMATCALRDSYVFGAGLIAGIIEAHVCLRVLGSVLKSIGKIFKDRGIEQAGEFAEGRADGPFQKGDK